METMASRAERIARVAHAGMRDLLEDYHFHLERVAGLVEGDETKAAAWLHDIIEDTPTTSLELLEAGISEPVVDAVRVLTHPPHPYNWKDYIRAVKTSGLPSAVAVKIADLKDHLRPLEPSPLKPERRRKYEWALRTLERK
jgi:(p)ppGpp synthase/HD superfamily hydrolase